MHALLVGEGDLSHGSFLRRMAAALGEHEGVTAETRVIEAPRGLRARLIDPIPRLGDLDLQPLRWRLRYSWHVRQALEAGIGADVALVNTQSVALLAAAPMRRTPTVLSVDVTGRQFAALEYWRPRGRAALASELPLETLERRALHRAAGVLAWTEWTARSLREDYGVPAERIVVAHPGVDVAAWAIERAAPSPDGPLRILFVGNHAQRKGLPTLLAALPLVGRPVELHVVTNDARVDAPADVVVHRGLAPNSPALCRRFAEADVFAFPTAADAAPWAIVEAMAAGLPVLASDVAAIPELLGDGAGIVVPRGDAAALAGALRALADDPSQRAAIGRQARTRACERYDQERQMTRIVDVLRDARERHARSSA